MNFLAPLFLGLAAAAAVPLLLHLMRRRIGRRLEFPAARYLARAEQEHSRKLRLRNLLLMLLRVCLILLVAAAAARPVGRVAGTGHPPTALALVLDNSLSSAAVVNGQPVLTDLVALARRVVGQAASGDRLWLVTADGAVQGGTAAALLAALDEVAPLAGAGDPAAALARAAGVLAASDLPARQVVLLTDGQASTWARELDRVEASIVAYLPAEPPPANHAVVEAAARPLRFTPRGAVVARVSGADSTAYTVLLGEQALARGAARSGEEIVVRASPAGRGWLAGAVELPPDELRGDDRRVFALWRGDPPAVRIDASAGEFATNALATLVQSGRAARGDGVAVVSADAAGRLPALLLPPSDPARLGAANRNLERLGVPWRFGAARRGRAELRGERLEGVEALRWYPLEPLPGAAGDTLASLAGGPWAVAGEDWVLLGSPLVPAATTLPLRASFVPWLGDVLAERLATEPGVLVPAAPGAAVRVPGWITGWEGPEGGQQLLDGGVLSAPAAPGVYFLLRGPERAGALVVNPEPEESVLDRLSPSALRSRLAGRAVETTTNRDRVAAAAFDPSGGRSLVTPLLLGALLALAAEGWVSRRGAGGHA